MSSVFSSIKNSAAADADNDLNILNADLFCYRNSFIEACTVHSKDLCIAEIMADVGDLVLVYVYEELF